MAIKYYQRPDKTWILWNDDSQDAVIQAPAPTPQAAEGPGDNSQAAGDMMAQAYEARKITPADKVYMRNSVRQIIKGDMSQDDRRSLITDMTDRGLMSTTPSGDMYSDVKTPGFNNPEFIKAVVDWNDWQTGMMIDKGLNPFALPGEDPKLTQEQMGMDKNALWDQLNNDYHAKFQNSADEIMNRVMTMIQQSNQGGQ